MLDAGDNVGAGRSMPWRPGGAAARHLSGKLAIAAKVSVSILLLWVALRSVDWSLVGARLTRIDPASCGMTLLLLTAQVFVFAARWRLVTVAAGTTLSLRQSVRYTFISTFFNQTLPSTVGGDAVRIYLLHQAGAGWVGASYSVVVDRVIGVLMLSGFVLVALPWGLSFLPNAAGRLSLLVVAAGCLLGVLGLAYYGAFEWTWTRRWWVTRQLDGVAKLAFRTIATPPGNRIILVLSALVHAMTVLAVWFIARAIAAPLSLGQAFSIIPAILLVATIPVSIGGWGVRETAMMSAFMFAGLSQTDGLLVSVLLGAALMLLGIVGGAVWIMTNDPRPAEADRAGAGHG
jgi:glycosyltransferase 2 family protein